MPKVAATDIIARGFRGEQFGLNGQDAAAFAEYLDPVLEEAGTWASQQYGAGYAGAHHLDALRLKQAEGWYVESLLWRRRIAFADGNAAFALEDGRRADSYTKLADDALKLAHELLTQASAAAGGSLGSSIAGVVIESGRNVATASRTLVLG